MNTEKKKKKGINAEKKFGDKYGKNLMDIATTTKKKNWSKCCENSF